MAIVIVIVIEIETVVAIVVVTGIGIVLVTFVTIMVTVPQDVLAAAQLRPRHIEAGCLRTGFGVGGFIGTLRGLGGRGVGGFNTYNKDLIRLIYGSIVPYPAPPTPLRVPMKVGFTVWQFRIPGLGQFYDRV